MNTSFQFFQSDMPSSRRADYQLGCLDGSVFIDFHRSQDNVVRLLRISFDGYGCCELYNRAAPLTTGDSALFIDNCQSADMDQALMTSIVKNTIEKNRELIWNDALKEYRLID